MPHLLSFSPFWVYIIFGLVEHGQTWKTLVSEFNSTTDLHRDVKNWEFKKPTTFLSSCTDLNSANIVWTNSEFQNQIASRTLNLRSERFHFKLGIKFDLVLMGTRSKSIIEARMNKHLLFSGQYDSKDFTNICSSNKMPYQVTPIETEIQTQNEKNVEITLFDFQLGSGGYLGIANLTISFLFCDKVYTEYDSDLQICRCTKEFYLNQQGECTICPLGCQCEGTKKCSSCTFDFMRLDASNQVCVRGSEGYSILEAWTDIPISPSDWLDNSTTLIPHYCGSYGLFGVFDYKTILSRIYSGIGAHYKVIVKFILFKLDSWDDNMTFSLIADGKKTVEEKFVSNADDTVGSLCGCSDFEAIRRIEFALYHELDTLNLLLRINNRSTSNGYWAIKNFEVSLLTCHSSCSTCLGPLAKHCKTCSTGFLKSTRTVNVFSDFSVCQRDCSKFLNCQECDESKCLVCMENYFTDETGSNCIDACPEGSYSIIRATNSICKKCSDAIPNCKNCFYNYMDLSIVCILCGDDLDKEMYIQNNLCVYSCSPKEMSFERSPKSCKDCSSIHPACLTCSPNICKSCSKPHFLEENSATCVDVCPTGMIQDSRVDICKPCSMVDDNCKECSEDLESKSLFCTLCQNGYFLKSGACVKTCSPNHFSKNNKCQPCAQMLKNCIECSASIFPICKKCETAYFLRNGVCSPSPCMKTQYLEETSRSCKQCINLFSHCSICTIKECLECEENYYLTSDGLNCISKCGVEEYISDRKYCKICKDTYPKCTRCSSDSCLSCAEGYFLKQGLCESFNCLANQLYDPNLQRCSNCKDFVTKCISCYSGSININCLKCEYGLIVRWEGERTICVQGCPVGDVQFNGYCIACSNIISNCQICSKNQRGLYKCEKCVDSYFLSHLQDECVETCKKGEILDRNTDKQNQCISCTYALGFDCKVCDYNATNIVCINCFDSFKILKTPTHPEGESCYPACPDRYVSDIYSCYACSSDETCQSCTSMLSEGILIEIQCQLCVQDYYLYGKSCVKSCPPYSEVRTHLKNECITCGKDEFLKAYYNELTNTCVNSCGLGTFPKSDGTQKLCKPCSTNCSTCNETSCLNCFSGYYLDENYKCINDCPSNTHIVTHVEKTKYCLNCMTTISNCMQCRMESLEFQCLECVAGYFLKSANICTKDCDTADNKYYVLSDPSRADLGRCLSCSPDCETCKLSEMGNVQCFSCIPSKFYNELNKSCNDSCPLTTEMVSVEEIIEGITKKHCRQCKDIIPFCSTCSLGEINNVKCNGCIEGFKLNNDHCEILSSEKWDLMLFSRYYPQFEETGCAQFGDYSKYRCISKNPVTFCKVHNGKVCIKCLDAYFLLSESSESQVCVRCPDDCFDCFKDFTLWRKNLTCRDLEGNFIATYFLASSGSKREYISCPSNCTKCEKENMCLICREGYIINFDQNLNSRICVPCESVLEGCKKCSYISFEYTPPTELKLEDIYLMTNISLFNMILSFRGARIVCENCETKYYFSKEGICEKCVHRINNCEACISFKDDTTIYDTRQFIDVIVSGNKLNFKVNCLACQIKNETNGARFTLTPAFDKCIDCPETKHPDEIKPLECQYFGTHSQSTFNQSAAFDLSTYSMFLMEVLNQSVMLASLCPPQTCMHFDRPVCHPIAIANCIDCQRNFESSKQICKACKPGFFLNNDTNECSACMKGCLDCKKENKEIICTRCSTEGYSLEISKKVCYEGIEKFKSYGKSETTACLSWGISFDIKYNVSYNGSQSFCLECSPGYYPSLRTGGCLKCNCIGCYEFDVYFQKNYSKNRDKSLNEVPSLYVDILNVLTNFQNIVVKCTTCQQINQAFYHGECFNCQKDCLRCEIILNTVVCTKYPKSDSKIKFEPSLLSPFYLVEEYTISPTMFYIFSSYYSVPHFTFLNNYIEINKYFNRDSILAKPCPYGCSTCEFIGSVPTNNYLDQYTNNCTGCRPGFYMDKINDLIICRFCAGLDSCTTALRLKFLFSCNLKVDEYRNRYEGYTLVEDFTDLINQLKLLNNTAIRNMHHETYLKELEIALFFPEFFIFSCEYSFSYSPLEFPIILSDLSHVLKIENTYFRLGSYKISSSFEIEISDSLRSTIKIKSTQPWNIFQFSHIEIENLDFIFEKEDPSVMEFIFNSSVSVKFKNVTFKSDRFIFKIEQAREFEIENVVLENIPPAIKNIQNERILFNLPNARSISIKEFRVINSTFVGNGIFSAGNKTSNIKLDGLELSGNYLKDFVFLRANLMNQSEQPVTFKNINISKTNCAGCSVLFLRGFSNVNITDFKITSSVFEFLFNSISKNGLLVFNIIPNITNFGMFNNIFRSYQFLVKNQEYEVQRNISSILVEWKIIGNKISPINTTFSGAFLIDYIPLESLKNQNNLLIENIIVNSNTVTSSLYSYDIVIPFISIRDLAEITVKRLKIYLSEDNYYLGIWKLQGLSVISFEDCSIEHKESPRLDNTFRYHSKENLFYIVDSDKIFLTKIEIMRMSFFESAIKIVKTSDDFVLLISKSNFMYNLIIAQNSADSGLIKVEVKSAPAGVVVFPAITVNFDQVKFQENYIHRKNIHIYTKSASCIFFSGISTDIGIHSSQFVLNTANNIYIDSLSSEIINTQFKNMNKQNGQSEFLNPTSLILGGYIEVRRTKSFKVVESAFVSGWAYSGGAIYLSSLGISNISIFDSTFEKLYALDKGGALFMNLESSETCKIYLKNLIVKDTFANEEGGFLQIQATTKHKTSDLLFFNVSIDGSVAITKGSFLSSSRLKLSFIECSWIYKDASNNIDELKERIKKEFLENIDSESQFNLEKIERASLIFIEHSSLYVKNIAVENIDYSQSQGAIFLNAINSEISLDLVKIYNNIFSERGIIDALNSEIKITSTEFSNMSYSKKSPESNGISPFLCDGCLNISVTNITVDSIICRECEAGFLFLSSCKTDSVSIKNSSFKNLNCSYHGGAVRSKNCTIQLIRSNFTNVHSKLSGGVLFTEGYSRITLKNCNIETSSSGYGGALYFNGGELKIESSVFNRTIASIDGGAIFVRESNIIIASCEMTHGKAEKSGGAIYVLNSDVFITNSIFKGFISGQKGGIIFEEGNAVNYSTYSLRIENCLFESAKAIQGGGLGVKYINLIVESSQFTLLNTNVVNARKYLSDINEKRILQDTLIQSNGGGIFLFKSIMNINNSIFTHCHSTNGGAIYLSNLFEMAAQISFCKFLYNKVNNNGGALNFDEVLRVIINDSYFLGNEAGLKGGGVFSYWQSEKSNNCKFILESVTFENNSAFIGGGMKYYNPSKIYDENRTTFKGNKAWNFGADITSRPKSMRLAVRNHTEGGNLTLNKKTNSSFFHSNEYTVEAFRSGAEINSSLIIYLLDEKGEVMTELENSDKYQASINIIGQKGPTSIGNKSYLITSSISASAQNVRLVNNTFVFENLILQGVPNSSAIVTITSPQILVDGKGKEPKPLGFIIRVKFRECLMGEYKNNRSAGITCELCQNGSYSLSINEDCKKCPENIDICEGNILHVKEGFWRRDPESGLVEECNSKENCLGGIATGNESCKNGSIGALCGSCDIYGEHWNTTYTSDGKSCITCSNKVLNIVVLVLFSLMQIFFTYTSIQGVIEMSNNETAFRLLRKFYSGGGENLFIYQYNYTAVYIKIFMNYITIFGFVWSFKLEIDTSIFEIAGDIGLPLNRFLYSLDCYVIALADLFKKFHIIYVKMIILSLMPMGLLMVFLIFYLLLYMVKLVEVHYKRIIYTAFVFVVIYLQPSIIFYLFKILSCTKVGDRLYVQADLSLECYTWEHKIYGIAIGVPLVVFWGIIIPFIFIRKLWLIRKQLDLPKFIMIYGFLYSEYRYDKFFWEFIKIYQKFLMIGFLNFFESDPVIKGLLVLLVLSIYYSLLVKFNPYKFTKLYIIDIISCGVCFLTILFALLCHQNPYRPFVYFNISMIAIINTLFTAYCLLEIFNLYLFDIKQKLESFQVYVATKIPLFAKCCAFKIKKFNTLRNWRRLKLAIHNYRRALNKIKEDEPKINELNQKAIEIMNLTSKKEDSNRENDLPGPFAYQTLDDDNIFIPESKNDDEDQSKNEDDSKKKILLNQNQLGAEASSKLELNIEQE